MDRHQMVEPDNGDTEEAGFCPQSGDIHPAACKYRAAQDKHEELRSNRDNEAEKGQNENRDSELRQYSGCIRHWQRLPEKNAAIAALPVKGIQGIDESYQKSYPHNQSGGQLVLFGHVMSCP